MKKYNFCAGPAMLPHNVVEATAAACREYADTGLPLMELGHRTPHFQSIMTEAQNLVKELLKVPEGYAVLFLGGGASMEFCRVPFNFLDRKAAYLNTGVWAAKAAKEARLFGEVQVVASSEDEAFSYIPKGFEVPADVDYLHLTSNNTIYGTEMLEDPEVDVPLVCDMSSDIFSRPVKVERYAAIYGGAQKNLSMAGLSFVIVREDALGHVHRALPSMMDYRVHVQHGSIYNTPPVVPIYCALQTLRWIKAEGGVEEMERRAIARSTQLYHEIDRNRLFRGTARKDCRSRMNITFVMSEGYESLADDFVAFAEERGIVGIRGHRHVGGFRASCYNAMPMEGVEALVAAMRDYEKLHASK